ncbi:SagB family peptide dehydrogenase [Metabacillus schmidteae]|uniref:SagB family peptide dehydrogenase n=1 Tax=Metabacillus schmidteae TaxID=2730405 RepID=UPI00158ABBBE|nr:SagB family peptide dehydrogenase [Metabacillus schmidteae]
MEGTRIKEIPDKLQQIKEQLLDVTDMDQVKVAHEIIDDTPYKTKNYMKYMHDEYYIQHNKEHIIKQSHKKIPLKVNSERFQNKMVSHLISNRHSLRDYENKKVDFETFSNIIHYSFGVKNYGLGAYNQKKYPFKYTNSQGGLNYLDLYIVVNNVEGLEQGLYYYDFINDELCLMDIGNMRPLINEINFQNEFTVYSNFICFIVADMERVVPKYYKRAYRFSHVDTGILAAYLQLIAEYHDLGSCSVAGYLEHKLEELLDLSSNDYPILSICFGYKPEEV